MTFKYQIDITPPFLNTASTIPKEIFGSQRQLKLTFEERFWLRGFGFGNSPKVKVYNPFLHKKWNFRTCLGSPITLNIMMQKITMPRIMSIISVGGCRMFSFKQRKRGDVNNKNGPLSARASKLGQKWCQINNFNYTLPS